MWVDCGRACLQARKRMALHGRVVMIQNHALERFIERAPPEEEFDEEEPAIGFTANIK